MKSNIFHQIPSLKSLDSKKLKNPIIYTHFYNPIGKGDWYVIAADYKCNDWYFYGFVVFNTIQVQHFTLKNLQKKKIPFNIKIKLDETFKPVVWRTIFAEIKLSLHKP